MVYPSVPLYLDHPPNWPQQHSNQQHHHQLQGGGSGNENLHLLPPPPMPEPPQPGLGGGGGGSAQPIRPNSMAERARMLKLPPPNTPLKCPRCESANTKFCYYNNYNLSQPRHYCKTCRRYWTQGGALRNVPVGGGCRRNKRSSSKSTSGGSGGGGGGGSVGSSGSSKSSLSSPTTAAGGGGGHMDLMVNTGLGPGPGQSIGSIRSGGMTSFMASLQNIAQMGMGNLGLSYGGCGPSGSGSGSIHNPYGSGLTSGGDHHNPLDFNNPSSHLMNHPHNSVQFSNMMGGGFELPVPGSALYSASFQSDDDHHQGMVRGTNDDDENQVNENNVNMNGGIPKISSSTMMSQMAPVKMEERQGGVNLAKQFMGMTSTSTENNSMGSNNNQFWNGNNNNNLGNTLPSGGANNTHMWTNLSGLNSSSSGHLL